jgi:hypothetical protein
MFTISIELVWPDGVRCKAGIKAESDQADYPVAYEGDASRLADRPTETRAMDLRCYMLQEATRQGAHCEVSSKGRYDRIAV